MEGFTDADVVSVYTDAQAVDDGLLVAINRADRVTRTVWSELTVRAPKDSQPPNCWPVDLMGWFQAAKISKIEAARLIAKHGLDAQAEFDKAVRERKALALAKGILSTHARQAKRVYDENIDGGIYKLFAVLKVDGSFESLSATPSESSLTLWILPNENGGSTLMFPEDY
ncbi:MAG TPA: hypothetical protein VMV59_04870 [Candidatus Dormibacteraeota bacterium]|nr:hypothetical protein [Candidatus Dormibacteraeota bacterium]